MYSEPAIIILAEVASRINIELKQPKTSNPFRLGQYILKLFDVIRDLNKNIKQLSLEIKRLRAENEELKKKLV